MQIGGDGLARAPQQQAPTNNENFYIIVKTIVHKNVTIAGDIFSTCVIICPIQKLHLSTSTLIHMYRCIWHMNGCVLAMSSVRKIELQSFNYIYNFLKKLHCCAFHFISKFTLFQILFNFSCFSKNAQSTARSTVFCTFLENYWYKSPSVNAITLRLRRQRHTYIFCKLKFGSDFFYCIRIPCKQCS